MKKQLIAAMLALSLGTGAGVASAEQPAANEYRQIFQSGQFHVEYKDNYTTRIIGEKNGARMERTTYETGLGWMQFLNPLGMLFGGSGPKYPEVMHKDGKYYQFLEKNKVTVCEDSKLEEENLDPKEGWNGISQKLALPAELAVFYWNDPYRTNSQVLAAPEATWSGKKTVDEKEYDCDRYASRLRAADGGAEAYYVYEMLYEAGRLKKIQSYVLKDGEEYPVNKLSIKVISGELPDNLFKIDSKAKVYEAGMGDMNDLLDQLVEIGPMEGI